MPLLTGLVQYGSAGALEAVLKAGADQDESTLRAALVEVDRMDIRDYPEKDAMRHVLIERGAKPVLAQPTPSPSISCRGTVSVADGAFVDFSTVVVHRSESYGPNGGGGRTWGSNNADADGSVDLDILQGATSASYAVAKEGYATVYAGPFTPLTKEKVEGIHFVLTKGFSAAIVTVDEAGQPIAGARLESYYPGLPVTKLAETTTDDSGNRIIEHIGEAPVNVRVLADGFQADEVTSIHLDPAKPYRWTLKKAQPQSGVVTAAATGQPIAGSKIKLAGVKGPHDESHLDPRTAPLLTTTDSQGRFILATLRPDSTYYLFVEASGYSGAFVAGIKLESSKLKVALGPELLIHSRIVHVPFEMIHAGKIHLTGSQTFTVEHSSEGVNWYQTLDAKGPLEFTAGPFYTVQGKVDFPPDVSRFSQRPVEPLVDGRQADFRIENLPKADYTFDLAPESTKGGDIPINEAASTPAPKPKIIEFEATVSTEDGAPAADDSATASIYESPGPGSGIAFGFGINQPGLIVNHQKGRFTIRPRADSRTLSCAVSMQGYAAVYSGPFAAPFKELENLHLTLRKGYATSVQTVDEVGQPIAEARLEAYYPGPPQVALGEVKTDASGTAVLEHIGEAPLNVRVYVGGFQMDEIKNIRLDPAKPYRWRLKRGLRTAGIVTDEFHRPIAGATVKLAGVRGALEVTNLSNGGAPLLATVDATGGFALTDLRADCRYCFFVEAPGHSGVYVRDYNPTSGGLLVNLGPELMVRGKVIHIPDSAFFLGGVPLFYSQSFMYQDNGFGSSQKSLNLHPKNGEADFSIGPFFMTQTGSMPSRPAPWDNGQVAIHVERFPEIKITVEDMKSFEPLLKIPRFGIIYDLAAKTPPVVTLDALLSQLAGRPSTIPASAAASPAAESLAAERPAAIAPPKTDAGSAPTPMASPVSATPSLP